jgi:putative ABC transport system permease protein
VRSTTDATLLAQAVSREILALDSQQPVANIRPLEEIVRESTARLRLTSTLIGALAATAVLLAAIGLFGVMAYGVQRRVPELGLRMVLGAQRADIFTLIMRRGAGLAMAGIAVGTSASLGFARVLATELHAVTPTDPFTYVLAGLVLLAVALAACWLPARRATRVDPLVALRTT